MSAIWRIDINSCIGTETDQYIFTQSRRNTNNEEIKIADKLSSDLWNIW